MDSRINASLKKILVDFQKSELTEYEIYRRLSRRMGGENGKVLNKIALDEKRHHDEWAKYTGERVKPKWPIVFFYTFISKIFGITFAIKLMEEGEKRAEEDYKRILNELPEAEKILEEEFKHEEELINMVREERLNYIGSMVLGLNDALVELTGALAGLTLALQNTRVIGVAGLITGIAASFSMGASEYLSQKSEEGEAPLKAATYTGIAYILTVALLVFPYFLLTHYFAALLLTLLIAVLIIAFFTFFISVVRNKRFGSLFLEMWALSFGVAAISFIIGFLVRKFLKVEI